MNHRVETRRIRSDDSGNLKRFVDIAVRADISIEIDEMQMQTMLGRTALEGQETKEATEAARAVVGLARRGTAVGRAAGADG
jgi:hypothetical protein